MLDSGANVFVVDEGSEFIRQTLDDTTLNTSGGEVPAKTAVLETPFGLMPGLISKGSPNLAPMHYVPDKGGEIRWDRRGLHVNLHGDGNSRALPIRIVDGIPRIYMPAERGDGCN